MSVARYPVHGRARRDFGGRFGQLDGRLAVARQLLSPARAGWSLCFVALFAVLGVADLGLMLEVAAATLIAVGLTAFSYSERRRQEDAFGRRLGVNVEATRIERTRIRATSEVLSYGECVGWLVACALLGYGAAQLLG